MLIDFNEKNLKGIKKGDLLIYGDKGFTLISLDEITKPLKNEIEDLKKQVFNLKKQVENTEDNIKTYKRSIAGMVNRFIISFKGGNEE